MGTNREQKSRLVKRAYVLLQPAYNGYIATQSVYNYQLFTWSPDPKGKRKELVIDFP